MIETFNIGDLVTSRTYGHGVINKSSSKEKPYSVNFDSGFIINYTKDGRVHKDLPISLEKGHLIKDRIVINGFVVYK